MSNMQDNLMSTLTFRPTELSVNQYLSKHNSNIVGVSQHKDEDVNLQYSRKEGLIALNANILNPPRSTLFQSINRKSLEDIPTSSGTQLNTDNSSKTTYECCNKLGKLSYKDVLRLNKTSETCVIHCKHHNTQTKNLLKCEIVAQSDIAEHSVTTFNRNTEMISSSNSQNAVDSVVGDKVECKLSRNNVGIDRAGADDGELSRGYCRNPTKISTNSQDNKKRGVTKFEVEYEVGLGTLIQGIFSRCKMSKMHDIADLNSIQNSNNNDKINVALLNVSNTAKSKSSMFLGFSNETQVKLSRCSVNSKAKTNWINVVNFGVSGKNSFIRCPEVYATTWINKVGLDHNLTRMKVVAEYNDAITNTRHLIHFGAVSASKNKEFYKRVI